MNKPRRRIATALELAWPFQRHIGVFSGVQRFAARTPGWELVIDECAHASLPSRRRNTPYDGVIARVSRALAQRARACGVPLVNTWAHSPARNRVPSVLVDHRALGKLVADYFIERGFRRFACLAVRDWFPLATVASFHDVLEEHGFACHCARIRSGYARSTATWRTFEKTIRDWVASWPKPIGVFVAPGCLTMTGRLVTYACQRRQLDLPRDVGLVDGMNERVFCELPLTLTSVDVGYDNVGERAAQLLEDLINGKRPPAEPILMPPRGVIERQSTDIFVVADEIVASALRYMSENVHRALDVDEVVDAVHTSRRTLERRFSKEVGRSIAEEIRRLRLTRVKRLLLGSDLSIKQIAHRAGFSDEKRLYEVFHRLEGMSPSDFRVRN